MQAREHWDAVYQSKGDAQVSWTQPEPALSLSLIREFCQSGHVIDVGGGTSTLVDRLLDAGYSIAVLDVSAVALDRAKARLGPRAESVHWIVADVTTATNVGTYDVWHDRAVFHFLTEPADRTAYVAALSRSVPIGGHAVIATFALDGPETCSGLPVRRYDGSTLAAELGTGFALQASLPDTHLTPWGKPQQFNYAVFKRVGTVPRVR